MTPSAFANLMDRAYTQMRPWSAAMVAETLTSPHVHFLSAQQGGLLTRIIAGDCEILALATDPDAQRTGVATALMQQLLSLAKQHGADTVFLEVASGNMAARAFYAHHGFAEIGQRVQYYKLRDGTKDDAVLLSRSVSQG